MFNVTFEPESPKQLAIALQAVEGSITAVGGLFNKNEVKAPVVYYPGMLSKIAPNIEQWHGASPDSWFRISP